MDRRNFIKSTCGLCISAVGLGLVASQLSSCTSLPIYKTTAEQGTITVPFSSLQESNTLIVRTDKIDFDILLVKYSETNIGALLMKCTHQDQPLTANSNGLFCSSHGSRFNLEGNVIQEPALIPLKKYKTEIKNTSIIIYLNS